MKVIALKSNSHFAPVTLTITIESKQELDAVTTLFNYGPVCRALTDLSFDPEVIREALTSRGGDPHANIEMFSRHCKR